MSAIDLSKLNDVERLALSKRLATNIRNSLPKELYVGAFALSSKLPFKATSLREVLMHRQSELADVAIELYEQSRLVPAFMVTRALVETTAMVYWLHEKVCLFLDKRDENAFDEFLMKSMLGSRDKTTRRESYNILTAVDRMDKTFKGFRGMYDNLCEFTHPNWSGVMGSFSKLDTKEHTLRLGKEYRQPPLAFGIDPLVGCLFVFQDYYNDLSGKLEALNEIYKQTGGSADREDRMPTKPT